jgi:cytosine/adenosine deaminase-related metal-dependent hydrolase
LRLAARFVVPRAGDVIAGGHVAWRDGVIVSVDSGGPPGTDADGVFADLSDCVVLPGLVNAHTHLSLSHLAGHAPPGDEGFATWVAGITALIRQCEEADFTTGMSAGITASMRAGTVAVGDIVSFDSALPPLIAAGLKGRAYLESLGVTEASGAKAAELLPARVANARALPGGMPVGVSPHAPYSTHEQIYRAAAHSAAATDAGETAPIATHVAESVDELQYCADGSGPLREFLLGLGIPADTIPAPPRCSPIAHLKSCDVLTPTTLAVHANYATAADMEILRGSGCTVVYCPRSHDYFGHDRHPVAEMLKLGIPVALGTDSLASNSSLSILDETAFLTETRHDLSPDVLLQMATALGAKALGTGPGVLEKDAPADLTAVALPPGTGDPVERVMAGEGEVVLTVADGQVLFDPRRLAR